MKSASESGHRNGASDGPYNSILHANAFARTSTGHSEQILPSTILQSAGGLSAWKVRRMVDESDAGRVWRLIDKIGFCMLSTHEGEEIRARPMAAYVDRGERAIYFLTDSNSHKDEDIVKNPHVGLAFADASAQKYASVSGHATVSNDRKKIKELWSTPAKAWWNSPDDPSIRVLKFTPTDAQYWDSPGTAMSYIKMFAAAMSDSRPTMGDHAKVKI